MKINRIEPQGYCQGVKNALDIVNNLIKNKDDELCYSLGSIIHNEHVIKELNKKGIITIDDKNKTRLELLNDINEGIVIFSAHGVSPIVYDKAKEKGLKIVDATCPMVKIIHKKLSNYINLGYECIYIGTKGHPECEGALGISNKIKLVTNINDISNLNIKNDKIYVTNQTTLSIYEIKDIFNTLKEKYPNIIIDDKICNATTIRQEALKNQPEADLTIIVGDNNSSNSKKLYEVSSKIAKRKTIFCNDISDLINYNFDGINTINISSGASTPSYLVDEIIEYLEEK